MSLIKEFMDVEFAPEVDELASLNAAVESARISEPRHPLTLETMSEYRERMQAAIDRFWNSVGR